MQCKKDGYNLQYRRVPGRAWATQNVFSFLILLLYSVYPETYESAKTRYSDFMWDLSTFRKWQSTGVYTY